MKIGVVGTGMIACEVLPLLSGTGWELSAICGTERSAAKLSQLGEKYGALTYTDYSAFLKSGEFDSVYLAVPNDLHFEFASRALSAGKHVIAEKPLAACYAEALSLSRLASEKKLFLIEAISNVHTENYAKLKELLPLIGRVKRVNITFARKSTRFDAFLAGETPPVFDPARCGGALMDIGIYNLHWL
ncbi:MAG: Gfo/Idh/MocA family oxidoreductase, partial [Oscillospiraceae bacterium]|nr:Gfo/Idh/MocA family oxidoreductase [Oscillospiraceae bacterium]